MINLIYTSNLRQTWSQTIWGYTKYMFLCAVISTYAQLGLHLTTNKIPLENIHWGKSLHAHNIPVAHEVMRHLSMVTTYVLFKTMHTFDFPQLSQRIEQCGNALYKNLLLLVSINYSWIRKTHHHHTQTTNDEHLSLLTSIRSCNCY